MQRNTRKPNAPNASRRDLTNRRQESRRSNHEPEEEEQYEPTPKKEEIKQSPTTSSNKTFSQRFRDDMKWFDSLNQPKLQPRKSVFGLVWFILYGLLIAVFVYIYFVDNDLVGVSNSTLVAAKVLFAFQLALNFIWYPLFFRKRSVSWGLVVIFIILIISMVLESLFYQFDTTAAWMYFPYLVWIGFAFLLNLMFAFLNPSTIAKE